MANMEPKLNKYVCRDMTLSFSSEVLADLKDIEDSTNISRKENLGIFVDTNFRAYFNDDTIRLIDYNRDFRGLPDRKAVLCAHGDFERGRWVYYTDDTAYDVQSWINRHDGHYKVLMIHSCNPGHATVYSKKSALLLPNIDFRTIDIEEGLAQVELYIPGPGYIDTYCIDEYVRHPEKMFKKKVV